MLHHLRTVSYHLCHYRQQKDVRKKAGEVQRDLLKGLENPNSASSLFGITAVLASVAYLNLSLPLSLTCIWSVTSYDEVRARFLYTLRIHIWWWIQLKRLKDATAVRGSQRGPHVFPGSIRLGSGSLDLICKHPRFA